MMRGLCPIFGAVCLSMNETLSEASGLDKGVSASGSALRLNRLVLH